MSLVALLFCVVGVNAKNNDWNVPDGLTKDSKNNIYEDGEFSLIIVCEDERDIKKLSEGFTKNENGTYTYYHRDNSNSLGFIMSDIGEYVKIGDKTYWVDASLFRQGENVHQYDSDVEKLNGYITYFNEHNNAKIIDV